MSFSENFLNGQPPAALVLFEGIYEDETMTIPDGLELYEDGDGNSGLEAGWSDDPEVLGRVFGFAQANHSASFYGLWQAHEGQSVDEMPVVLFGDEGGQLIVASNAHEWMRLLTTHISPYIDTNWDTNENFVSFVADEDEEEEEGDAGVEAFRRWVASNFGYEPISGEEAVQYVERAQAQYQAAFQAWITPFLS